MSPLSRFIFVNSICAILWLTETQPLRGSSWVWLSVGREWPHSSSGMIQQLFPRGRGSQSVQLIAAGSAAILPTSTLHPSNIYPPPQLAFPPSLPPGRPSRLTSSHSPSVLASLPAPISLIKLRSHVPCGVSAVGWIYKAFIFPPHSSDETAGRSGAREEEAGARWGSCLVPLSGSCTTCQSWAELFLEKPASLFKHKVVKKRCGQIPAARGFNPPAWLSARLM